MGVRHGQYLGQSALEPGVFGACSALRAVPVAAGVVLPVAVLTGITGQLLPTQGCGTAGSDAPPGFGLGGIQDVRCQVLRTKAAQYLGHGGGHGCAVVVGAVL
jgi:hypothetical protein